MTDLWRLSAAQLTEGYAQGLFTPSEALQACLARAAAWQPLHNAFAHLDAAGAHAAAAASTLRWQRGEALGPLDGVPVSLKDNLHAHGQPTRWGSRLVHHVPAHDEAPVARLRAAGAVLFGKTNLPEFAMQGSTFNRVSGVTRNPWDLARTPGGSSGGAVAAVASGCGPLALATDGGGSIRRPASHCGLVGFKPSMGVVPRADGLPEIFLDYEVAGPIARTVQDAATMLQVLAPDLHAPLPAARPLRILFVPRFAGHPVDADIARLTRQAAQDLAALGHTVQELSHPFTLAEEINALWPRLSAAGLQWMLANAGQLREFGLAPGSAPDLTQCTPATLQVFAAGVAGGASGLFEVFAAVARLRAQLAGLFSQHDVLLTPAAAALPWPAAQGHPTQIDGQAVGPRGHAVFTAFANAAGLPAVALPCGEAGGLPVGLQLVAAPGADALLLALARHYEQAHPWAHRWPAEPAAGVQAGESPYDYP